MASKHFTASIQHSAANDRGIIVHFNIRGHAWYFKSNSVGSGLLNTTGLIICPLFPSGSSGRHETYHCVQCLLNWANKTNVFISCDFVLNRCIECSHCSSYLMATSHYRERRVDGDLVDTVDQSTACWPTNWGVDNTLNDGHTWLYISKKQRLLYAFASPFAVLIKLLTPLTTQLSNELFIYWQYFLFY